jgi:cyclopropane fatty-acyl-phospholipid synthase-like methyltransferase
MMHFLTPQEASAGFSKIYDWLVPGGKLFFIVITPYHFTPDIPHQIASKNIFCQRP